MIQRNLIRRDFCKSTLALAGLALDPVAAANAASAAADPARPAAPASDSDFPKAPGLTKYVSEFIVKTTYEDIPPHVIELGKKTILDGFGLALAGSNSASGPKIRQYIESLGPCGGSATVIGTKMKAH